MKGSCFLNDNKVFKVLVIFSLAEIYSSLQVDKISKSISSHFDFSVRVSKFYYILQ